MRALFVFGLSFAIVLNLHAQVVPNGNFESWTGSTPDSWTTIDPGIVVSQESVTVNTGSAAASVTVNTITQDNTDLQQSISVISGHTYTVSCYVYHTEGHIKARLYVDGFLSYSNETITGAWQQVTSSYTATATGEIIVGLRFYDQSGFDGSEVVYVDDFTLTDNNGTKAEPSNHVSGFSVTATSMYSVVLSWTDNDGAVAADAFLVLINTSGTFTDPVDGVFQSDDSDISDGSGAINIDHGTESASFSGLNSSTSYYLKIWPYTNSGGDQDYKIGGSVPTASLTTASPQLLISEIADPSDSINARFVELFNAGTFSIDFSKDVYYLAKQTNGGSYASVQLSGSVNAGELFIVSYSSSTFRNSYGFASDQNAGSVVTGNGDDAYLLYYGGDETTGTLKDIFGVQDQDGTGQSWEYTDSKVVRSNTVTSPVSTMNLSEWTITGAVAGRMSPGLHPATVWNGSAADNDWTNAANWDNGLPSATVSAVLWQSASAFPTLSSSQSVDNLRINSGASLVGVEYLSVSGTASLLRDISTYTSGSDGWHLIASPMTAMTISGSDWVSNDYDLYLYDEDSNLWLNQENSANSASFVSFTPGIGYLFATSPSGLRKFEGTFNSSNVTVGALSKSNAGWHVLGNPFPAPIQWASGWTLTNTGAVAQVLKADGSGYRTLVSGEIIPAGQGFWVQVSTAPGSVTIPLSACTHSSQAFSAKTQVPDLKLRLHLDSVRTVETRVRIEPGATPSFDWDYDAHYLPPTGIETPQMFTLCQGEAMALNTLPPGPTIQVPLVIEVPALAMYLFTVEGIESLLPGTEVHLIDSYMGYSFDLTSANQVLLEPAPTDSSNRFSLVISSLVTSVPENPQNLFEIHTGNGRINIQCKRELNEFVRINLYNIVGKELMKKDVYVGSSYSIPVDYPFGVYIIRVECGENTFVKKIVL